MQRRLVAALLSLVVVALLAFTLPVGLSLVVLLRDNLRDVVLREARTVAFLLADTGSVDALISLRGELEAQTGGRVELLDAAGRPALGRPVTGPGEPDVTAAYAGRETVAWVAESALDGASALVVTVPARAAAVPVAGEAVGGAVVGVVRVTYPTADLEAQIRGIWIFRGVAGVATVVLAAGLAVLVARSLSRPLRDLEGAAERFGRGDLTVRAREGGPAETRRVARAINDGAQRLERTIRTQEQFIGNASHQLRSPLTALRLSLDNVQDRIDDPETREDVDLAVAEVVRLSRLVSSMLVLARAQADAGVRQPVDVGDVVATRIAAWQAAAADRDVVVCGDPAPARALLGGGHLEQVLDNLVANALDAAPAGSRVRVDSAVDGGRVRVQVRDRGPGMTAEQRARAFDRFDTGRPGGTGLGLAIVRQLVEDDHGTVELRDAPGGGLLVDLTYPHADGD